MSAGAVAGGRLMARPARRRAARSTDETTTPTPGGTR